MRLGPQLGQLLLALLISRVALLHVGIDPLQPFFVLLHTFFQVIFGLLLLLKYGIVVDLLQLPPLSRHLFLDVHDETVLEPDALVVLVFNQGVVGIVYFHPALE